jgi:hypothetical protein
VLEYVRAVFVGQVVVNFFPAQFLDGVMSFCGVCLCISGNAAFGDGGEL